MSVLVTDLRLYGSASMPDDDTPTNIGGAISLTRAVQWVQSLNDNTQIVSSNAGDTTQSITVSYLDSGGVVQTVTLSLNGTTPVTNATVLPRLLKGIKSATCAGDVAIEAQTAVRANTAQTGSVDGITLDAGASAVDNFYIGQVLRITSGTGVGQIRQVLAYNGTTKIALVSRPFGTPPDNTSVFRLSKGFYFEKSPSEILEVRELCYNAAAGVLATVFYDKIFFKNTSGTDTLLVASIIEALDPSGLLAFAVETTVNGSGGNGGGNNRHVAPSAGVSAFDSTTKSVPGGGSLAPGDVIGVWVKLALAIGEVAQNTSLTLRLSGSTA